MNDDFIRNLLVILAELRAIRGLPDPPPFDPSALPHPATLWGRPERVAEEVPDGHP